VKITINNPQVAIEEHEGDRSINDDDWWMEWPDFVFRSDGATRGEISSIILLKSIMMLCFKSSLNC
jgi:hypothetical protein